MQVEDSNDYYVVVGDLQSYRYALVTGQVAKDTAFAAIEKDSELAAAAKLLHGGVVINGKSLFDPRADRDDTDPSR